MGWKMEELSDKPYFEAEDYGKLTKLEKKKEKLDKKIETERVKQDIKKICEYYGIFTVNRGFYVFIMILSIFWSLVILGFGGYSVYLWRTGQLNFHSLFSPVSNFNNTFNLNSNSTFNNAVNNEYTHTINTQNYNNFTINVVLNSTGATNGNQS